MPATKKKAVKKKSTAKSNVKKKASKSKAAVKKKAAAKKAPAKKASAKKAAPVKSGVKAKARAAKSTSAKSKTSQGSNGKTKALVAIGKAKAVKLAKEKKGILTFDDLGEILPTSANADQIDEVMITLNDMNVKVVDELRQDTETQKAQKQKERAERKSEISRNAAASKLERADDPVRMYLREMGRVPLLTKEQEVEIAKRIEAAEDELTRVLLQTPYVIKEIHMLSACVMAGRLSFSQVTDIEDLRKQNKFVKNLPIMMEDLAELSEQVDAQEKRLERSGLS
ncbi:MAG: sigma-70 factor domain-containing protein, partial [Candidatus Hydrogenedentota bacterium]